MLAKYPGPCCFCNRPITVGKDTYDLSIKKSYHEACKPDAESRPDPARLADELGYIDHATLVATDVSLWDLLEARRMPAAGRTQPEAQRGQVGDLFGEDP